MISSADIQALQGYAQLDLDLAWIEVKGPDARKFLNGVLTNNIQKLHNSGSYNLLLTPKGKIVADCFCYTCGDHFGIVCANSLKETVLGHLKKFIVFQKVELDDQSERWGAFTILGPFQHPGFPDKEFSYAGIPVEGKDCWVIFKKLWGHPAYEIWGRKEDIPLFKEKFAAPLLKPEEAEMLRIESGTPAFGKDFDENTIPQEACLYAALSFDKGCFVGQEIVARLEHRGHVGKQLVKLVCQDKNAPPPTPAEKIFLADQKEIGWVASSCFSPQRQTTVALGYLRYQFLEEKTVFIGGKPMSTERLVNRKVCP